MNLNEIIFPIKEEIKLFNKEFKAAIRSKVGIVDTIARYLLHQKGKKIRPILVLLSAKASGGINQSTYHAATLVELLHTATLIHDDVVDNADVRRGIGVDQCDMEKQSCGLNGRLSAFARLASFINP